MSHGPLDPSALLTTLTECGVDYVVIGALAVGVHGEVRGTGDVDVMVPAGDEANKQALERALAKLDATRLDAELGGMEPIEGDAYPTVMFRTRHGKLDILYRPDGSDPYERIKERSLSTTIGGRPVAVVGKSDLIRMKLAAGRRDDLDDVSNLTASEHGEPRNVLVTMKLRREADPGAAIEFASARVAYFDQGHRTSVAGEGEGKSLQIEATRSGLIDDQIRQWARSLAERLRALEIVTDDEIEIEVRTPL